MLQGALGSMQQASAAAPRGANTAPAEKPGWFDTKLVAADLKDNEFAAVAEHPGVLVTRAGKVVSAFTSKCTHKGCTLKPKEGEKIITCGCHQGQFNLDGTVKKGPPKEPLAHFAIRLADKGNIEVDPGQKVAKDDKNFSVTIA
jgi:Rieske Fe-S protein